MTLIATWLLMSIPIFKIKERYIMVDCEYIVNYDECALHSNMVCNGCMNCPDQKPIKPVENKENQE